MIVASQKDIQDLMNINLKILSLLESGSVSDALSGEEWLSTSEAQERLKIKSHTTLHNWRKKGWIAARRRGEKLWEFDVRSFRKGLNTTSYL